MSETTPDPADIIAIVTHADGATFVTPDHPEISFGRGSGCEIRFGHDPVDRAVSRSAGRVVWLGADLGRVAIENLSTQIGFDIKTPEGPLEAIRPRGLVAPPEDQFEIRYAGTMYAHVIRVQPTRPVSREGNGTSGDEQTVPLDVLLTERQWAVLDQYAAPIREGGTVPSTHNEVAKALGWSSSLVRLEANAVWGAFVAAGVPMRDYPDKRDAIVDAALRHNIGRATSA
jgi:hypothetical protein